MGTCNDVKLLSCGMQAWPPHERRPSQGLKIYIYELPFALNHIMVRFASAPFFTMPDPSV